MNQSIHLSLHQYFPFVRLLNYLDHSYIQCQLLILAIQPILLKLPQKYREPQQIILLLCLNLNNQFLLQQSIYLSLRRIQDLIFQCSKVILHNVEPILQWLHYNLLIYLKALPIFLYRFQYNLKLINQQPFLSVQNLKSHSPLIPLDFLNSLHYSYIQMSLLTILLCHFLKSYHIILVHPCLWIALDQKQHLDLRQSNLKYFRQIIMFVSHFLWY